MWKRVELWGCLLAVGLLACSSGTEPQVEAEPRGKLLTFTECKSGGPEIDVAGTPMSPDCFEYEYDGKSKLTLTHINAGFNCCPSVLTAQFQIEGSAILITEGEQLQNGGCHCLCLYDIEYEIVHLTGSEYTITVNEPYLPEGDEALEFTIDLDDFPTGSTCRERSEYPWDLQ